MRGWASRFTVAIGLLLISTTARAQPPTDSAVIPTSHVRSTHRTLLDVIAQARQQSPTFRRLVETINASDGLVYIQPGTCRHGVRACLFNVKSSGQQRVLFIKVDIKRIDRELMAAIGHELQHAVEVLGDPRITDYSSMYFFYKLNSDHPGTSAAYETKAAIQAGLDVAEEIRQFQLVEKPSVTR